MAVETGSNTLAPRDRKHPAKREGRSDLKTNAAHAFRPDRDPTNCRLLERYCSTRDPAIRDALVQRYERVVQWVVNRRWREVAETEDLLQIGRIALFQAIERFEPGRGVRFASYAASVIAGSINHYRRDHTAFVRIPRSVQSLAASLPALEDSLISRSGRSATTAELAEAAGVSELQVRQALQLTDLARPMSLDEVVDDRSLLDTLGYRDERIDDAFSYLHDAVARLEPRSRFIVQRRFFDSWTQRQIASSLGVSQMHVSRLERQSLCQLRTFFASGSGADSVPARSA